MIITDGDYGAIDDGTLILIPLSIMGFLFRVIVTSSIMLGEQILLQKYIALLVFQELRWLQIYLYW